MQSIQLTWFQSPLACLTIQVCGMKAIDVHVNLKLLLVIYLFIILPLASGFLFRIYSSSKQGMVLFADDAL
jgi:hypothetical protein